ncbi:RTA1 like protein-domain-containing protein [Coprinopsis sp. MPI-PUGE-AT-0042]|nr:RTA1 like protein-domain-containing protein [Coprinopsis sp. MPI-PUGE-AT-0042]KAH6908159.1 RTA1 like protein-domain-containing protein [Coprinopsis sp. MPI-PUGE-AT-0042]
MSGRDSLEGIPLDAQYGYIPSRPVAVIFIILFALSTGAHLFQAIRPKSRTWFMLWTAVLCGVLEILGWGARLWAHYEPLASVPFQIQIVATIIGPTPLLAANFIIFGRIIRALGASYSRVTSRWYTIIFCSCDIISLVVQAVGGAIASMGDTHEEAERGGQIMLGGIVFQLIMIVIYCIMATEYCVRYFNDRPVRAFSMKHTEFLARGELVHKIKIMLAALALNTVCLFIRSVYRTIELSDGWNGRIIRTEVYFNVLDGAMVVLAIYAFNYCHPGRLLEDASGKMSALKSETSLPLNSAAQKA